jgi:hypothetical protein
VCALSVERAALAAAVTALEVGHPNIAHWAGHRPSPVAVSVFRNSNDGLGRLPFAPAPFPSLQEQSKIHCLAHLDAARVVPGTPICDRARSGTSRSFSAWFTSGARDVSGVAPATQIEMAQVAEHSSSLPRHGGIGISPCSLCMHDTARACACRHQSCR